LFFHFSFLEPVTLINRRKDYQQHDSGWEGESLLEYSSWRVSFCWMSWPSWLYD
jgi:hypothetical protein